MPVAKPSKLPRWASVGAQITEPPETASAGISSKDVGFLRGKRTPADYPNWVLNNLYQWMQFLDDIQNQTFNTGAGNLGKWSGLHMHTRAVNITTTVNEIGLGVTGHGAAAIEGIGDVNQDAIIGIATGSVGSGAGSGVHGIGDFTSPGVLGEGGLENGTGVKGIGGNSAGIGGQFTGGPGGAGVVATAGTGNGKGVDANASGTAAAVSAANSGTGPGMTCSANSNKAVDATSSGTAPTISAVNSSTGAGISCSSSSGPGLVVGTGNIQLTGAQPAAGAQAGPANGYLTAANIVQAWGNFSVVGGVVTRNDGINGTLTIVGTTPNRRYRFTFARPLTAQFSAPSFSKGQVGIDYSVVTFDNNFIDFSPYDTLTNALKDAGSFGDLFTISVVGRQ